MKAWRITHIKSNWPFIVCHENQLKINTSWAGEYNPDKCGVTVEQGQFLTDQELEQIKEQVAREAYKQGQSDIYPDSPTFNDYWQQKNKGENPILKRMNGDIVSAGNPITKPIKFDKGEG